MRSYHLGPHQILAATGLDLVLLLRDTLLDSPVQIRISILHRPIATEIHPDLLHPLLRLLVEDSDFDRPCLEDPPALGHDQLVVDGRQSVEVVLCLLGRPVSDGSVVIGLVQFGFLLLVLVCSPLSLDVQMCGPTGYWVDRAGHVLLQQFWRWSGDGLAEWLVEWPKRVHVEALLSKHFCVEEDASVAFEALPDHPSQWDLRKLVPHFVLHRASTNIGMAAREPDLEHIGIVNYL